MLAATLTNAQYLDNISFDGKKYPVQVRFMAIEQLPHLKWH